MFHFDYMVRLLLWHHIHYLVNHFVSTPFVFPTIFSLLVCLVLLYLCVHLCMSMSECVCMHICWHGNPEEEGRPRRRRTPRFLLKPWSRSRQTTESRLGLQVKKARRQIQRMWMMWWLGTNLISLPVVDNQILIRAKRYRACLWQFNKCSKSFYR